MYVWAFSSLLRGKVQHRGTQPDPAAVAAVLPTLHRPLPGISVWAYNLYVCSLKPARLQDSAFSWDMLGAVPFYYLH